MTIIPVVKEDKVIGYRSSPVYTTINGVEVWVSDGYEARTIVEICKLAYVNAVVRHMRANLCRKFTM